MMALIIFYLFQCMNHVPIEAAPSRDDPKGYYEILGLNPSCSQSDIKAAYRKLTLKYHPDRNRNKPEAEQKAIKEKYVRICQAYETLSDENKRQAYSRGFYDTSSHGSDDSESYGSHSFHFHQQFQDLSDLFKHFHFGGSSGAFEQRGSNNNNGGHAEGERFRFNPFGSSFFDDEDDDDFGFPFHFGFPHHHQQQQGSSKKKQQQHHSNSQSSSNGDENKGGLFSGMFDKLKSAFGLKQEEAQHHHEESDDSYREGYQRVKKVVTKIASDGTRTTYVTYEYIPTGQNRRGFSF
ncbi:hypothetical protein FDP41_008889 [Naegleria fowleri]|uniref:J domain-containing protein n=1 Tax=Naegleria fowleri TaxID=5763 RepID=A0A6A5BF50_NAEFO|nr:uncharacterized protein FDP41_008889 [Naegleria fowleri]KAF0972640.1 hypothetical protein FDP41_008889 [Naegleria fowleri]